MIDGVFERIGDAPRFHPSPGLDAADVEEVLATVEAYVRRLLAGSVGAEAHSDALDRWAEDAPVLAGLSAASVQGQVALGPRAGRRLRRHGTAWVSSEPPALGPCHARHHGFDLHAGLRVPADARDRLERIARYALRPPVARDRLQWTDDGQVRLELRRPWSDGTTHLLFEPVELLARLAVLTPRPRVNLILYHDVLAPRAAYQPVVKAPLHSNGAASRLDCVAPRSHMPNVLPPRALSAAHAIGSRRIGRETRCGGAAESGRHGPW